MVHGLNTSLAIVDVLGASFRSSLRKEVNQYFLPNAAGTELVSGQVARAKGDVEVRGKERYIVQLTST